MRLKHSQASLPAFKHDMAVLAGRRPYLMFEPSAGHPKIRHSIDLEARAVGAYNQVVRYLGDPNLLRTVAGAMGTDGQHLVVLRQLAHRAPVPGAFERGIAP